MLFRLLFFLLIVCVRLLFFFLLFFQQLLHSLIIFLRLRVFAQLQGLFIGRERLLVLLQLRMRVAAVVQNLGFEFGGIACDSAVSLQGLFVLLGLVETVGVIVGGLRGTFGQSFIKFCTCAIVLIGIGFFCLR